MIRSIPGNPFIIKGRDICSKILNLKFMDRDDRVAQVV
jgi:hypothetical protein